MTEVDRPLPEQMLARLRTEGAREEPHTAEKSRGRLKIFFGCAAGVGKTYTMLEAARGAAIGGREVLLGYIEPHGRPETAALLLGQEILPAKDVAYRGVNLRELDLDAALARKPELILVDELAHTNAPGCRHVRRWQDVEELLGAGIDVWTTLNVQHLESLNDVVAQITGIVVRETVPDRVFDEADDVELVDLPPDDLLERFREGKVYVPEQAERAAERFFRKANLVALRELAMRRVADRVSHEVQTARLSRTRTQTWPTTERLIVCVGPSPTSAKVVRTAKRMASAMHAHWIAVHTETPATAAMDAESRHRLAEHLKLAERLGAEAVTITGEDVAEEVVRYAQSRNATKIVIGKTGEAAPRFRFWRRSVVDRLVARSGDIDVYVIRGVEERVGPSPPAARKPVAWAGYLAGGGLLFAATLAGLAFRSFGLTEPNIVLCYLLATVLAATFLGRGPAVLASALSVLLFNFFFTEPRFTFVVEDSEYVFTFLVMFLVALVVSALTTRIRYQVELARERERRTAAQYRVSQALAATSGRLALAMVAEEELAAILGGQLALFAPEEEVLRPLVRRGHGFPEVPEEIEAARWVFGHGLAAGRGTDTLPACRALYLPLLAGDHAVGVIGWSPRTDLDLLELEKRRLLETFATQIALAIERDRLAEESRRILAEVDAERLRSSLLSAVSHDLRTPLAAIAGSASAMLESNVDRGAVRDLARSIYEEADRLSRLLENLLYLTRIESGGLRVAKEWHPVDEVVGSALGRAGSALKAHVVKTAVPADLPLVSIDGLLIEQVLVNLLDNAAKFSPPGSEVVVAAARAPDAVEISVADRGEGLGTEDLGRVFDRSYRTGRVRSDRGRGAGLGLSICEAVVRAHGGRIRAESREGAGTRFVFTLPTTPGAPDPVPAEDEEVYSDG